jgi:Zn-finger nucleic acid-binding protein
MAFCTGCGNEVPDPNDCPICRAGRATPAIKRPKLRPNDGRCYCPRCDEPLDEQNWEGTITLSCPSCRGTFFPGSSLEQVLDRLRASSDPVDAETALQEFKDRFKRQLPEAVRYKACPVCEEVMARRAYGTVSGVIVDHCGDHGTWVDEAQFAALADFICRGGDVLASEIDKVRARIGRRGAGGQSGRSILERFLGGG